MQHRCASASVQLETATEVVYGLDAEGVHKGTSKWNGVAVVGTKVYMTPYKASNVLVIAPGQYAWTRRGTPYRVSKCLAHAAERLVHTLRAF